MTGVQADELDKLINSLRNEVDDIKSGLITLNNSVSTLSEIFKSNGVNNVSNSLQNLYDNQANIAKITESYVDILAKVNSSYRRQEEEVSNALKIVTKN